MSGTLRKIFALLTIGEYKKLYGLVIMIVFTSMLDIVGIASIFPFLNVISNPEVIQTNVKLKWVYETIGFASKNNFLVALGGASFVLLLASNALRAITTMALFRFTWLKHYIISKRLLSQYLNEPYAFFLNRNSSELTAYLQSVVARVVSHVLIPCMQLFAKSLLTLLILGLLFVVDPLAAILVILIIGGGYVLIYVFARRKLSRSGEDLLRYDKQIFKILNEAFGGIKDIKLLGKERVFVEQYADTAKKTIKCYTLQFLISQLPRYTFEAFAFGGILLITIYLVIVKKDYQQVIPLIGLYAFAAYRLMPALHQIFCDFSSIRFERATLNTIYHDFFNCTDINNKKKIQSTQMLPFSKNMEFRNVTFQYPKAQRPVIENLNLIINANTTIGFVGSTGAGKTTTVDILLGLLWPPQQGEIIVDDIKIDASNLCMWQANIGYVSQHIYLSDDTIARNIAFGMLGSEVNYQAVQRAAQLANIHNFIMNELPNGYETEVGERGVRLSGGERQRIGIARALYRNPSMIVLDEATSAVDGITENAIREAINQLAHKKTIIIIAHRLSTVKDCDMIYMLERGKIIAQGTYRELLTTNQQFRQMANEDISSEEGVPDFSPTSTK